MKERRVSNRRTVDIVTAARLESRLEEIYHRVFNGLGNELRKEVKEEIASVRNLFIGFIVTLVVLLAGVVVQGMWSSSKATSENNRNLEAIHALDKKLELHLQQH
jgi:hypothetical protein